MAIINWLKANFTVDRGAFEPGSHVELLSRDHTDIVTAYDVYEQPPKFLKIFARGERLAATLPAKPLAPVPGRFHTEKKWRLPTPENTRNGRLTFIARVGDASSGTITSASMLITSEHYQHEDENREKLTGEVKPAPGTKAALELEHRSRNESTIEVKVKPTLDPDVEILLFHGRDVRAHIEGLVDEWFEEGSGERSTVSDAIDEALAEYIDGAWSIEFPTQRLHVGPPDEVTFSLRIPLFDGLRAVMCLQVNDLDNKTTTISDPRFITGVGERIVMSDLVPKLFDDQTQTLAKTFSDQLWNNGGELSPETEGLGAQLVEALGTGDIDDVIALLGAG